jgi:hypothetical protein
MPALAASYHPSGCRPGQIFPMKIAQARRKRASEPLQSG